MKLREKKKLLKALDTIPDFRKHEEQIKYPLSEILFMSLFALIKGDVTFDDIHFSISFYAENKLFKKLFGKNAIEIPSRSTLHRILINTDNNALEVIFRDYFGKYIDKKNIAVDGKWLRGSDIKGQYTDESHKSILNIFDKDTKIVMGHKFMKKDKSHEIPAFKEMLEDKKFCNEGQIFTFDALLTQEDILNTINEKNNKYIARVKNNQKSLKEKVELTVSNFLNSIESYEDSKQYKTENSSKSVKRIVDIFYNKSTNRILYHEKFDNIQTLTLKHIFKNKSSFTTGQNQLITKKS